MNSPSYIDQLHIKYQRALSKSQAKLVLTDCLRIDLHCHDKNSDVPDELWGRLLRLPETWLETDQLITQLERSGCSLFTVTNHNNARSCWSLVERRSDVLVGAEFTCHFPDVDLSVHVLCYGFSQAQETELNRLRHDAYEFVRYARQNFLPLVLPHPLFFYSRSSQPSISLLERFAVMFERFEVLNGQRGVWQNSLTLDWVESLTPEYIDQCATRLNLDPHEFCLDPYNKRITGGSDDHNGLFAGQCGTLISLPNMTARIAAGEPLGDLAKEALLYGEMAPYGEVGEEEKLTTTFLDYFAQVVLNMRDPGLIRLMLHKGETQDKLYCLIISNAIQELQRHKYTLKFLETFHEALQGKKPTLLVSLNTRSEFKPVLKLIKRIARTKRKQPDQFASALRETIPQLQWELSKIFFERLNTELAPLLKPKEPTKSLEQLLKGFEIPTHFRSLVSRKRGASEMSSINLGDALDQLSFPALAAGVVLGAGFMGTQVLYKNRDFINTLSESLHGQGLPNRTLWLTDTLADRNGVSIALNQTLEQIDRLNLPIDILTCHPTLDERPHLKVVRPISQLEMPILDEQVIYVPDILRIQKLFEQGGYDRIICSTELLSGFVALYLKHAFSVPAHFFMHTDWLVYTQERIKPSPALQDRLRRMLRAFYHAFDGVITLNDEHRDQLTGPEFAIDPEKIIQTGHWPARCFSEATGSVDSIQSRPMRVLYVGRLSAEKGVLEIPEIWEPVRTAMPNAQFRFVGTGPAEAELRLRMPEAEFTGWLEPEALVNEYRNARALVLPSRFDTFGCVIVEALCLGVPTVAYNCKGPRTVIENRKSGLLVENSNDLSNGLIELLASPELNQRLSIQCINAASTWSAPRILRRLIRDLEDSTQGSAHRSDPLHPVTVSSYGG